MTAATAKAPSQSARQSQGTAAPEPGRPAHCAATGVPGRRRCRVGAARPRGPRARPRRRSGVARATGCRPSRRLRAGVDRAPRPHVRRRGGAPSARTPGASGQPPGGQQATRVAGAHHRVGTSRLPSVPVRGRFADAAPGPRVDRVARERGLALDGRVVVGLGRAHARRPAPHRRARRR